MANIQLTFLAAILAIYLIEIHGHGRMMDPLNRSSIWRSGNYSGARANYNDMENFCGGQNVQHSQNGGKCGPCGDNVKDPVPRKNENGGIYGNGIIVKNYKAGEQIQVTIDLTASHKGHFEFNICELKNKKDVETEECFDERPLELINEKNETSDKYSPLNGSTLYNIAVHLPKGYKCEHCVLRWHYRTGNTPGNKPEMFRSCADIAIL